jgi:ribonuclease J
MQKDFLEELDNELSWTNKSEDVSSNLPPKENNNKPVEENNRPKREYPKPKRIVKEENQSEEFTQNNDESGDSEDDMDVEIDNDLPLEKKWTSGNEENYNFKQNILANFPQTKFYMPTLRDGYTRFIPIGWNNETGSKNMNLVQYWDEFLIIDCWVQFAEPDMLWASYSIPDISALIQYKKQIKWMIITHAHLDHIWALKHILPALWMPTLYWTKLTIWIIKKSLEEYNLTSSTTFVEVSSESTEQVQVGNNFKVEFFRVNHSVPDCAWVVVETPSGFRLAHTWDFKIDFTPAIDKPADLARIWEIWRRWVNLLLSDSTGSIRKWFSTSESVIWENLEKIIWSNLSWRLIITIFSSWISRIQQIINSCEKNDKFLFLSWRSIVENVAIAKELWYIKYKPTTVKKLSPKTTEWIPASKQVIITTWSQWEEFSALTRMAEGKHNWLEIIKWDTIVFSSSVVPGNERNVIAVINKLIRLWANVITKDDREIHTGWHAYQEEQKIMINLTNPKYFMPVYWDLYFRNIHKKTAMSIWMQEDNILLTDNWTITDFAPNGTVFKSKIKVPIQEIIIDGHWIWTSTSHVIKAREKMMESWVLVIIFKVDAKTKAIIWHLKLESRGLVYLEEVRMVHKIIIKKAKSIYENTVKDVPEIEEKDLVKIIKNDLESFLSHKIDRNPMIIPIVMEV